MTAIQSTHLFIDIFYSSVHVYTSHAIQNNDITKFVNNLNKVALTNVTVWNYTIIRIFLQQIRFYSAF